MSSPTAGVPAGDSLWVRFWHAPVRAERLALMRIMLASVMLADQLILYLPHLADFYGPEGFAPAGLLDAENLKSWRLTSLFFTTDNLYVIYPVFGIWVAVTIAFLVGWQTRWMNVLLWFLTRCMHERNPSLLYGGDSVMRAALFLLMFAPTGAAFSLDAWRQRRQGLLHGPALVPPWSLRIIQIQLCLIYFTAGMVKLKGDNWGVGWWTVMHTSPESPWPWYESQWPKGSWWDGTALHYFLNDTTMARRSFAEYPVPYWLTKFATHVTVWWEAFFPLLMLNRWTRRIALLMGVMMHIGIAIAVDIGWFSYYTLCFYAVWTPDSFWRRFDKTLDSFGRIQSSKTVTSPL